MRPPEPLDPRGAAAEAEPARETDYGADVAATTSQAVPTGFDPATGARLTRLAKIVAIVLLAAFVVVRGLRFFDDWRLSRATAAAEGAHRAVDLVEAKPVDGSQRLSLPGETRAWYTSTIYARVSGFLGKWTADIGDRVKKGQQLATIETPELDAELAAARAQLRAAQAEVVARESEAEFARTSHERWRDSPPGVVSDQERDAKRSEYESAVAKLRAAEAEVALDRARVEQFAALAEFKRVVAPFDGVITERHIDIGNLVTAGSTSATTPLYRMSQNDPLRVYVDVPQDVAAELMRPGQAVEVETVAPDRYTLKASVARASGAINAQARTLRVEVDVPNGQERLLPGMYVRVAFELAPRGRVQVPAAALIFRSDGPQVACVDAAGRVSFRKVTIARDDGSMLELGSGVAAGERLALNISSQIREGDSVEVSDATTAGTARPAAGH